MVLVLENGLVRQQMLALKDAMDQERLSSTADKLNQYLRGVTQDTMQAPAPAMGELAGEIFKLVQAELQNTQSPLTGEVLQDGLTNVLAQPEFSDADAAQRALRVFEERPMLADLLAQTLMNSEIGGVQVLIGGEGRWEERNDFSLVLARYGTPNAASGYLGVLGPIRMAYGRAVSTVDYVAGLLSGMMAETMNTQD